MALFRHSFLSKVNMYRSKCVQGITGHTQDETMKRPNAKAYDPRDTMN